MYSTIDSRLTSPSRKREREDDVQLIDHGYEDRVDDDNKGSPRKRKSSHQQPDILRGYLILHRVACDRKRGHERHEEIEDYLEDQAGISIVVYKTYDCREYHEVIQDQFERLPTPDHPADVTSLLPYFFRLNKDGIQATPKSWDTRIQSPILKEAIQGITGIETDCLSSWQDMEWVTVFITYSTTADA
ncbi:hypothetical protein PENSTE_c034G00964 [Penicillium steckii]|uniref:Uncharacterized protein n=1 Tax=Penicillium steckii TaxID=303698 RepID=A0A1V6SKQ7_9EURO|nr:hypothetical protein PENSTE_c034G00964 [Penicillium steckii]